MPCPTLGNKSQNFHFLHIHKDFISSVVKLLKTDIQTKLITLQVKIKLPKYHPMNLHWSFSAQLTDPLEHSSCVSQNFNMKNIHKKKIKAEVTVVSS